MLTLDDKLIILIEECGEVIQAATKCLRFGYYMDHKIGYGPNNVKLSAEVGDLLGVIDSLSLMADVVSNSRETKMDRAIIAKHTFGGVK